MPNKEDKYLFKLEDVFAKIGLIPTYTELSVFFAVYSALLVLVFHPEVLRMAITEAARLILDDPTGILLFLLLIMGMVFTVYYAFNFKKTPPPAARMSMVFLAVIIQIVIAFSLFITPELQHSLLSKILAYLNLAHAFLLGLFLRTEIITANNLLPVNAKRAEVTAGMIIVTGIFLLSTFVFKHHPALTMSICASYAMIFNDMVMKKFLTKSA